jgi:hypothetical protein
VTRAAPTWLEEFQARFGSVLRTPLDRATGTLVAAVDRYDPRAVRETLDGANATNAASLAVYNRQYWFRMFEVLHGAFPLTCRLVGYWSFNEHATRHLLERAPRGWDVEDAVEGFVESFANGLGDGQDGGAFEREAFLEAARIDASVRAIFRAPPVTPFRPSAADAARLLDARLIESPAVAIVREHRPLLELRRTLLHDPSEARAPLPARFPAPRSTALVRTGERTLEVHLEAGEAELLELLREHRVRDALASLERACPPVERAGLPDKARVWLARSVQRGWWTGMR